MKCLTIFLVVLLLASNFLVLLPKAHAQADWWNSNWQYRTELTFDYTKITANQTDFPVLVRLNSSRVSWEAIKDNLADLRFVANNQTLAHEVESYTVNSEAWIWVKTNTSIPLFMYYGNPIASSIENKTAVWGSSNVMTQHMKDETTSTILDSTSNNNDGTKKAANEPVEIAGKIGEAQNFDGIDDYVDILHSESLNITGDKITLAFWIKMFHEADQGGIPLSKTTYRFYAYDGYWGSPTYQFAIMISGVEYYSGVYTVSQYDVWYYLVGVYDGVNLNLYIDGILKQNPSQNGNIDTSTSHLKIQETTNLKVDIDEVRIYNQARSEAWIKADYYSQSDGILTYGSEENYVLPAPEDISGIAALAFILAVVALSLVLVSQRRKD